MDTQAVILASLRGCHLLALASLFGTLVSLALIAPAGLREAGAARAWARQRLVRLALWSDALALLIGAGWMLVESATIAGSTSIGGTFAALVTVARGTQFGHLVLVRFVLLLAALPLLGGRGWRLVAALVLAGAALAMQGGVGHAGATGGTVGAVLLVSEGLHLLAAGAWLGGLLPLFLLVGSLPPRAASASCHNFTPVGLCAVLLIACTAVVQAWQLIGGLGALFGTTYGRIALLKLALFLTLLLLAVINRFVLTERLHDTAQPVTVRLLRVSLAVETVLGILVILVAAFLASGTPGTHETPIWPFSRQPSLELLYDSFGRVLLLRAAAPSLIAGALVVASRFWRPLFWPALAGFVVTLVFVVPNLASLLTVDAYPTTFVTSPTEFADSSIMHGAKLFAADCTACHGADARGDGPMAKSLPDPPADLTAAHFWGHTDGDLFWYVSHGIDAPSGAPAMPAFGGTLPSGDIWALIDFLKANNAGYSMRTTGRWSNPIPLPQFDAVCADGSAINLDDLRGRVVHVIAASAPVSSLPPSPVGVDVATIVLARDHTVKPVGAACVTVEQTTWDAFAVLLGVSPDALTGTQALVDQNGWLRARWRPGDPGDWDNPQALATAIRDIATHPLAVAAGGHAHHH
ncbi:MAG TPA: CopD family protein [Acetobacteraceae bacterium]|nr:CopD family protein [Acetobacteraceae bacterium]